MDVEALTSTMRILTVSNMSSDSSRLRVQNIKKVWEISIDTRERGSTMAPMNFKAFSILMMAAPIMLMKHVKNYFMIYI